MPHSKEEIFNELKKILQKLFEINPQKINLESRFYEDLDLDSIDAVDLIVHLQTINNKKFNPEEFKSVKTIADVVEIIYADLSKQ